MKSLNIGNIKARQKDFFLFLKIYNTLPTHEKGDCEFPPVCLSVRLSESPDMTVSSLSCLMLLG